MDAAAWTARGGRVFADLWDLERLASCDACLDATQARLRAMNLTQRRLRTCRARVLAVRGSRMTGRHRSDVDVAIVGSGFAGALTALALRRAGPVGRRCSSAAAIRDSPSASRRRRWPTC